MPTRGERGERGEHCPFLNRADARCGGHFRLDGLAGALSYCFDRYTFCSVYHELLLDRQLARARAQVRALATHATHDASDRLVQLGLPRRFTGDARAAA